MTRIWFTRRAIALHVTVLVVVPAFLALAWWQFDRASSGNELSWAYTFEWPIFAAYAVFMWWKLVHEWPTADADSEPGPEPGLGSALPDDIRAQIAEEAGHVEGAGRAGAGCTEDAGRIDGAGRVKTTVGAPGAQTRRHRSGHQGRAEEPSDAEDEQLRAYNEYLAALNASDRKKTW